MKVLRGRLQYGYHLLRYRGAKRTTVCKLVANLQATGQRISNRTKVIYFYLITEFQAESPGQLLTEGIEQKKSRAIRSEEKEDLQKQT